MHIAVVGSGPTGFVSSKKLLERGYRVTIIDTALEESDKHYNSPENTQNQKLFFGSNLPYRQFLFGPKIYNLNAKTSTSFAAGGLSLVWGATMLPFASKDLVKWPMDFSKLEPFYSEISGWIPIAGRSDQLSSIYNDFISRDAVISSQRVVKMLETISSSQDLCYGFSRLAVETGTYEKSGCYYCNNCLSGCPGSFIWTSQNSNSHIPRINLRVINVEENEGKVYLSGLDSSGKLISNLIFDKIFLAAGPVESFRILANSRLVGTETFLQDSTFFQLPMLISRKYRNVKPNSFGLSQVFIRVELEKPDTSVFYQLYDFSEDLFERVRSTSFIMRIVPRFLLRAMMKNLMIGVGYLTSSFSPQLKMEYLDNGDVIVSSQANKEVKALSKKVVKVANLKLSNNLKRFGIYPLGLFSRFSPPGTGVHYGGWLPMGVDCDLLGRPSKSKNIHVVDSSILPSIPAGPITFTIMANALRITSSA